MKLMLICAGLLRRDDRVLLVRCTYPGEPKPLWVLPGGGHKEDETLEQTVVREFREETSLEIFTDRLAYASESIDEQRGFHVLNFTLHVRERDRMATPVPADPKVVEARFVRIDEAPGLLSADVLRIPVAAALSGTKHSQFFVFDAAKVEVPFFTGPGDVQA